MKLCEVARPLMRWFPRQSITILGYLGAGYAHDREWENVVPRYRSYFDRQLQCVVTADLAEWGGRSCYFWARFFDVTHQAVLREFLHPGDTYIDIGANVGYQTMFASRRVGSDGEVLSFEPNPDTYAVLTGHIAINRIRNCRTFQMALGDCDGEAVLHQLEQHSGTSTLRSDVRAFRSVRVPVRRGDDVLRDIPFRGKVFMKMDVEGFEQRVLAGLGETLARVDALAVEVIPAWLTQQGGSAEALYEFMRKAGFRPLLPELHWTLGLFAPRLRLLDLDGPPSGNHDALFVR